MVEKRVEMLRQRSAGVVDGDVLVGDAVDRRSFRPMLPGIRAGDQSRQHVFRTDGHRLFIQRSAQRPAG